MKKYELAALRAVTLINDKVVLNPIEAWSIATGELFGEGSSGQKKGCPKNTFLGLCEEGKIIGIPSGKYNHKSNSLNKEYGLKALELIKNDEKLLKDTKKLWLMVTGGKTIKPNYQIEIVKILWERDMIKDKFVG